MSKRVAEEAVLPAAKRAKTEGGAAGTGVSRTVIKFTNCQIVRHHKLVRDDLWVRGGKIIDPQKRFWEAVSEKKFAADIEIDCLGFIDLQINGAFGVDFTTPADLKEQEAGVAKVAKGLMPHGVTAFVPTVVTSAPDTYRKVLPGLKPKPGDENGACVLGTHLEGPFISVLGAHPQELTRVPSKGFGDLMQCYGSLQDVRIVTLAPELAGAQDCVREMAKAGVVVSAGHSKASFDESEQSVRNGVTLITHLFNAMVPFHHRDPGLIGLIGAGQDSQDSVFRRPYYSLIADGHHAHPASIKIAYRSHPAGAVLVTDAIVAMGLGPGRYQFGAFSVDIRCSGKFISGSGSGESKAAALCAKIDHGPGGNCSACTARLVDKETLAGSIVHMDQCVRNFQRFTGCTEVEAIEAASLHPAAVLGLQQRKGTLDFGADADLVLLDRNLHVRATFVDGRLGWAASVSAKPAASSSAPSAASAETKAENASGASAGAGSASPAAAGTPRSLSESGVIPASRTRSGSSGGADWAAAVTSAFRVLKGAELLVGLRRPE